MELEKAPLMTRLLIRSTVLALLIGCLMNVIRSNPELLGMYQ